MLGTVSVPGVTRAPVRVDGGVMRLLSHTWAEGEALRSRLHTLARGAPALDLRLARILAWIRTQDLAPLGFPGWLAFTRERVEWGEAWVRSLVRLVRSGLLDVLRAVCAGRIPLGVAVRAPSMCTSSTQLAWIAAVEAGEEPRASRSRTPSIEPEDAESLIVWHARQKVRLLEGLPLTDREADERMLAWWREDRPSELVASALAPAPRPRAAPGDDTPAWSFADPADALLGPWRTPTDLSDAMGMLDRVQAARRGRTLELGRLYERVVREGLHRTWGFRDVETFCQVTMNISARSLQRHRELGRTVRRFPATAALPLSRAAIVGRIATRDDVERWVAVAQRTAVVELEQAAAHVEAGADPSALLDAYEAAMATTTHTVALASVQAPVPPRLTDRVHPDLPQAARWLLAVQLPPQRGFGKVKERDHFVCANPECRRRALRNQAHHLRFRHRGGDDTPENGVCVCPSCHLRLIHAGHVQVERVGANLVWRFPDRTVTVAPGPPM